MGSLSVFLCFIVLIWFQNRKDCLIDVRLCFHCSWGLSCTETKGFSEEKDLFWSKESSVCHRYLSHQGVLLAFNIIVAPPSNHHTVCNWACLIKKKIPLLFFFYTGDFLWNDAFLFVYWKSAEYGKSVLIRLTFTMGFKKVLHQSRTPIWAETEALIADKVIVLKKCFTLAQFLSSNRNSCQVSLNLIKRLKVLIV